MAKSEKKKVEMKEAEPKEGKEVKEVKIDGVPVYCAFSMLTPIDELIENPKNPNLHPMAQLQALAKIIRVQGWRAPITVSLRSGFITKGHGRLKAGKLLGLTAVPVDYQEYETEAAEWADMVADNKIAELATTDDQMLESVLKDLSAQAFDVELTGLSNVDLADILGEKEPEEEEPGTEPEAPGSAIEEEFTQEVMESHNYVVMYFDNEIDWMAAKEVLGLHTKHSDRSRAGFVRKGIGRVLRGAPIIEKLQG